MRIILSEGYFRTILILRKYVLYSANCDRCGKSLVCSSTDSKPFYVTTRLEIRVFYNACDMKTFTVHLISSHEIRMYLLWENVSLLPEGNVKHKLWCWKWWRVCWHRDLLHQAPSATPANVIFLPMLYTLFHPLLVLVRSQLTLIKRN